MNYKQMRERQYSCAHHPLNRTDQIVVEEIWVSTIEICKRLDALNKHLVGSPFEGDENPNDVQCIDSPHGSCGYDFEGGYKIDANEEKNDPTCKYCELTSINRAFKTERETR